MSRVKANNPCDADYDVLAVVWGRLSEISPDATLGDAIAFMQYAAISQLNANFVTFIRHYDTAEELI